MTVTMNVDEFLNTLNQLIESANGCLQDRARLADSLSAVRDLEAKANARLAWSRDFEDHMRNALVGER